VKRRILAVEDNPLSRELICDWLESEGYEVISAATLGDAFDAVQSQPPHAILLDVHLGADDGLKLAAWIRKQPSLCHIPVIAVSAHAMVMEQERILLAGCNTCVSKPVNLKLLGEELEHWLTSPSRAHG
jgi:two-component system cell cycle response regulator DivK